jgi:hypothetical protein
MSLEPNATRSAEVKSSTLLMRHPQTVRTDHPRLRRARRTRSSRFLFASIFSDQNFLRVDGSLERRHPLWPCQKHPFTKIATWRSGRIMSGVPGSCRSWRRKRIPRWRRNFWTNLSGSVFDPRTRPISQLRFFLDSLSAIFSSDKRA